MSRLPADLNDAYRDPGVRTVIATRGGAGAYRIADDLDFAAVRADPRPLVGFSDTTDLNLALWRHCRVTGVHGGRSAEVTRRLLMEGGPTTLQRDPAALTANVEALGQGRAAPCRSSGALRARAVLSDPGE